jgi:hypothetical protein
MMQTLEQSEMDVDGIPKATEAVEVLCELVQPLLLGVEVAAGGQGDGLFFEILRVDCE